MLVVVYYMIEEGQDSLMHHSITDMIIMPQRDREIERWRDREIKK